MVLSKLSETPTSHQEVRPLESAGDAGHPPQALLIQQILARQDRHAHRVPDQGEHKHDDDDDEDDDNNDDDNDDEEDQGED